MDNLLGSAPAKLDSRQMHLWAPTVDGILRRFNDEATRPEAALSAAYLLQAMKAIGVFDPKPEPPLRAGVQLGGAFMPAQNGQRPKIASDDVVEKLERDLKASRIGGHDDPTA